MKSSLNSKLSHMVQMTAIETREPFLCHIASRAGQIKAIIKAAFNISHYASASVGPGPRLCSAEPGSLLPLVERRPMSAAPRIGRQTKQERGGGGCGR